MIPGSLGRYRMLGPLSRGETMRIDLAVLDGAAGFQRQFAIKRLVAPGDAESLRQFTDEARLSVTLDHPNIVSTFEFGVEAGEFYLVSEHVDGPDLQHVLAACRSRRGRLAVDAVLYIARQVASALEHAHTRTDDEGDSLGIVHRGVCPTSVLLSTSGTTTLSGFGLARFRQRLSQTLPGVFRGDVAYASPEQIEGGPLDGRSDLFSLGTLLYEMLTGTNPFLRGTERQTMAAVLAAAHPPARSVRSDVPGELSAVVDRCLRADAERRYDTAGELRLDLARLMLKRGVIDDPALVVQELKRLFPRQLSARSSGRLPAISEADIERHTGVALGSEPAADPTGPAADPTEPAADPTEPAAAADADPAAHAPSGAALGAALDPPAPRSPEHPGTPSVAAARAPRRSRARSRLLGAAAAVVVVAVVHSLSARLADPPPPRLPASGQAAAHVADPGRVDLPPSPPLVDGSVSHQPAARTHPKPHQGGTSPTLLGLVDVAAKPSGDPAPPARAYFARSVPEPTARRSLPAAPPSPEATSKRLPAVAPASAATADQPRRDPTRSSPPAFGSGSLLVAAAARDAAAEIMDRRESARRARREAAGTGALRLTSEPWANVAVDGRLWGSTPLTIEALPAGKHMLELENPELRWATSRIVTIRRGATLELSFAPSPPGLEPGPRPSADEPRAGPPEQN